MPSVPKNSFTVLGTIQLVEGKKKFVPKSPVWLRFKISHMAVGREVATTFSEKLPTRSQAQLAYHWCLVELLADHCGNQPEELHDAILRLKFGTSKVKIGGKVIDARRSVADVARMSKGEMMELIEFDLELCAVEGVQVPTREQLGYLNESQLVFAPWRTKQTP